MKINIIVAGRYRDLPESRITTPLVELNRSPKDIKDYLDQLIEKGDSVELMTVDDTLINLIGAYIEEGTILQCDVSVNIYKGGSLDGVVGYTKEGYLSDGWPLDLLSF